MAKEVLIPNEVKAPTLFVGVGGTGGKIVKRVAELCKPEERENVNFACLDTNVNDLSNVAGSGANIYYIQTSNTQTVGDYLNFDEDALRNWFPKNAVIYDKTVSEGAGQVRAISRLALNATIKTGKIQPLYKAIDDLFRKDGKEMKQAMRVVIVSTASGGTGSGIMTPLAMFIRDYVMNKYPNASLIVRALVLLPETLDSVISSSSERESQRRNAYATIKEINAFMMKGSGFFDVNADLKRYRNLSIDFAIPGSDEKKKLGLLPFDFCFLLDGQNAEDSTLINVGQYIEQAAQALYQQNIGPMQKDAFSMEDNIIKEMSAPGMFGRNRFGGIGAGTLAYPYEKVVKYVAYDWAKDAIGGEGEATKWSKYDKQYEIEMAEARKNGVPATERPTRGQVYIRTMDIASDQFSKDMRNAYTSSASKKIKKYMEALKEEMHASLKRNPTISASMVATNELAGKINYTNEAKRGRASSNLNTLRSYEMIAKQHAKKAAAAVAEGIFNNEAKTINEKRPFTLECFIKDQDGKASHPNAVRYMLYMLEEELKKRAAEAEKHISTITLKAMARYAKSADDTNAFNAKHTKEDEANIDALCMAENEENLFTKIGLQNKDELYEKLNRHFPAYHRAITEFAEKTAEIEAYRTGADYVEKLSKMYEKFYATFKLKVAAMERRQDDLVDELRFHKGDSARYVCATKELLSELSMDTAAAGRQSSLLEPELNGEIFDAVKKNVAFEREINASDDVIEEDRRIDIFDEILLGYFERQVQRDCDNLDMNIVEAMARENVLKARAVARRQNDGEKTFAKISSADNENYIRKMIKMGSRLAAPGIQRLRSEESRELVLCAYNKVLNDMRNYRVKELIPEGTSASAVETVSRYEMHFYNALYNLTPDKLDKFAAPDESETRTKNAGLYHNAYVNYSRRIGPDSTKGSIISTHIDKRWDNIAILPELDFHFQEKQIMRIHQALIYGLIYKAITCRALSNAAKKRVYKYENSEERYVDLAVSNGTLCDEFYEILDSLYVSAYIVEDLELIRRKKCTRDLNRNSNYHDTVFAKELEDFKLDFLHDGKTSLFEIPVAYYNTLPNSKRYTSEINALVDAVIKTFRDELSTWESGNDVKFMLCDILKQQFFLLMENYTKYEKLNTGIKAKDHAVLDVIFRKVRKVIETTPEPDDYEGLIRDMKARLQ